MEDIEIESNPKKCLRAGERLAGREGTGYRVIVFFLQSLDHCEDYKWT